MMTRFLVFLGFLSVGLMGAILMRPFFRDANPIRIAPDKFSRLGWVNKIAILFIVVQLTMFGGAKHGGTNDVDDVTSTNDVEFVEDGTNDWTNVEGGGNGWEIVEGGATNGVDGTCGEAASSSLLTVGVRSLTSGETPLLHFPAPYRLESVSTNEGYSHAMPVDGNVRGTWHLTGAYEDVQKIGLESLEGLEGASFVFPIGNQLCTSLWAYTWGKVRPQLRNASNEIVAVGAPMSAIPDVSRFWTAATSNDTYLLTWESFAKGRISGEGTSSPLQDGITPPLTSGETLFPLVSAQIELFRNGDFVTRSNDVESVWRRVNPDDWDDDGIPNEDDPEPLCRAEGEARFGPHQAVPEGDDANHYCWVDVVVRSANARVTFEGVGGSWLPDPSFIAEANATNRVMILIGKTYAVRCGMPVEIVGKSDEEIETWTSDGVLTVEWPVWFEYVSARPPLLTASPLLGSGSENGGTTVRVHPLRMGGGDYSWMDDFCCYSFAADGTPVFDCRGDCGCGGGCRTGEVTYECSGHVFSFGGWCCGCADQREDDHRDPLAGPGISANFSAKAIVFEDAYTNAPGQCVGGQSTDSEVTCSAYGGTNGISYSFTIEGADGKLRRIGGAHFPMTGTLAAGESFVRRVRYDAVAPSADVEDIVVRAAYTENGTGAADGKDAKITAVKVKVEATACFPSNKVRHVFGPKELFNIITTPSGFGASNVRAPFDSGGFSTNLAISGVSFGVSCAVIHPLTTLRGEFVREMTAADWIATRRAPLEPTVVGAGFVARWYMMPSHVSFHQLWTCEGEAPMSSRWGCFTDETNYPTNVYGHTSANGAIRYAQVGVDNEVGGLDRIGVQLGVPPSSSGGFSLVIPLYWGAENKPINRYFATLIQMVGVTAGGETTISKGGLSMTRGVE